MANDGMDFTLPALTRAELEQARLTAFMEYDHCAKFADALAERAYKSLPHEVKLTMPDGNRQDAFRSCPFETLNSQDGNCGQAILRANRAKAVLDDIDNQLAAL